MHFVPSTDSKPRLRWTTDLHQRFIDAINQLGGADSKYKTILIITLLFFILLIDINIVCGRSNTKEYNEGDGNSRTYLVPSKEPFTGIPLL
jgi:hypothetical protein